MSDDQTKELLQDTMTVLTQLLSAYELLLKKAPNVQYATGQEYALVNEAPVVARTMLSRLRRQLATPEMRVAALNDWLARSCTGTVTPADLRWLLDEYARLKKTES